MPESAIKPMRLNRKDFISDQDVRWCPGCGDYAILAQMQRILPALGVPKEKIVFVSGIGCSSRFPYYMNTYGMHSIHGRAPTLATGLKVANPDLHVWVITGDGDGLSIGGNHLLHVLRRNVDLNIILFNNQIYGLTKGQYSPTSPMGTVTKTSPMGSMEQPFNAISVVLGAEATFVARTVDRNTRHMAEILQRAQQHRGTSFVEIYQNCNIFNDGAFAHMTDADIKDDNTLMLEHGQPMIFGKDGNKGIRLNGLSPQVVPLTDEVSESDLLVHDEHADQPAPAYLLSRMTHPEFPVPLGVFRCVERPTYEDQVIGQAKAAVAERGEGDLATLYHSADTWIVPERTDQPRPIQQLRAVSEEDISDSNIIPSISEEDPLAPKTPLQYLMCEPVSTLSLLEPECVPSQMVLEDAIIRLNEADAGCLIVTDDGGRLTGIFAQGDVFYKMPGRERDLKNTTVASLMTENPTSLHESTPVRHVLHLMALHGYRHIPIIDEEGKPVKLASFKNILKFTEALFAPD